MNYLNIFMISKIFETIMESDTYIRFICDDNLGKLARYLRVGGFDTAFDRMIADSELLRIALDEDRIILTRDRKLIERKLVRKYSLVEDDLWPDQLKKILAEYDLHFFSRLIFSRCLEDNTPTVEVEKERIKSMVYPYTYRTHQNFRQCPLCKRVYWHGTHVTTILQRLKNHSINIID